MIPERLAFHEDPAQRAFYSHWTPAMRNVARYFYQSNAPISRRVPDASVGRSTRRDARSYECTSAHLE